jgi:undecaprenyl-diphosphatase
MERLQAVDEGMLFWFENHHSPVGNAVMQFCTRLGDPTTLLSVVGAVMILFWLAGRRHTALIVLLASLVGMGISESTKYVVQRERPDVAWRLIPLPEGKSFPSGHALDSLAVYGAIALTTSRCLKQRVLRRLVIGIGLGLALPIGLSRTYLGVHYPSDVLGGWTAGLACALLAYWADLFWEESQRMPAAMPAAMSREATTQ